MKRFSRKRRLIVYIVLSLAAAVGYAYHWKWSHRPVWHQFTTQRNGEPRHVWRAMQDAWTFQPGPKGTAWGVNDLLGNEARLYYISDCEAGCLDPDTGKAIWRFPLVTRSVALAGANYPANRRWRLIQDKDLLYACETQNTVTASYEPFRVCALDAQTGKERWESRFYTPPIGPVCVAGAVLLLPDSDGTIKALRRTDGTLLWQRRMTANRYPLGDTPAPLHLNTFRETGVLQVGSGHLLAFQVRDGAKLWSVPSSLKAAREAENDTSTDFVLQKGVCHTLLEAQHAVAINIATGRQLWSREADGVANSQVGFAAGAQDKIVCLNTSTLISLHTTNGKTAWLTAYPETSALLTDTTMPPPNKPLLYLAANYDPLVNRFPRLLRSVPGLTTLLAVDAETGQEQWRWQPTRDMQFDKIVVGKHRLYFSDQNRVTAVEDGQEESLPDNLYARSRLARHLLSKQYQWPVFQEDPVKRMAHVVIPQSSQEAHIQEDTPNREETAITLLALGHDSIEPLLEFVRHAVTEQEQKPLTVAATRRFMGYSPNGLSNVLDLLFDQNDSAVVPFLIAQLQFSTHAEIRDVLVQTLLNWGDKRALRALYTYAQSPTVAEGLGEDALYFVCRNSVPPNMTAAQAGWPPDAPTRQEVTDWLLKCLADRKTPNRLYVFAKFELLNDRGEIARHAALATFHREAQSRLFPVNSVLKTTKILDNMFVPYVGGSFPYVFPQGEFPRKIVPVGTARDASGHSWAAFRCSYLGKMDHIWFAQSEEKKTVKRWSKPTFGLDISVLNTPDGDVPDNKFTLTWRHGRLHLEWVENTKKDAKGHQKHLRHHWDISITDLYRDSDGDGITDLTERELGTNPFRADTNANGLPDSIDKNPLYRQHKLTNQEAIYQAVLEALCQLGRSMPSTGTPPDANMGTPMPFGRTKTPLFLPTPPCSQGVEIRGHMGMVFCRPLNATSHPAFTVAGPLNAPYDFHFTAPSIDFDGAYSGVDNQNNPATGFRVVPPVDPFKTAAPAKQSSEKKSQAFKDFFPVVLSHDGARARIGYTTDFNQCNFDVEVRKINGRWLPVECRRVYWRGHHFSAVAVTPIRDRTNPLHLHSSWRWEGF